MKIGSDDRKKLIAAGSFGVLAVGYLLYTLLGTGSGADAPPPAPATVTVRTSTASQPVTAVVHSAPSNLDPTLHPEGMLLAESLVYSGSGRNIFLSPGAAAQQQLAAVKIPKAIASPRFIPPTSASSGPPPLPPIELRFFGTATRPDGKRQAFFLRGDDVLIASQGDVVGRRYRVGAITATAAEVTDLTNNNTQRLPMSAQ